MRAEDAEETEEGLQTEDKEHDSGLPQEAENRHCRVNNRNVF